MKERNWLRLLINKTKKQRPEKKWDEREEKNASTQKKRSDRKKKKSNSIAELHPAICKSLSSLLSFGVSSVNVWSESHERIPSFFLFLGFGVSFCFLKIIFVVVFFSVCSFLCVFAFCGCGGRKLRHTCCYVAIISVD